MSKNLKKCDELIERLQELKKALQGDVRYAQSNRVPAPGLPAGWSVDRGTGDYHHSVHGVVSPGKQSDGTFRPVHSGGALKSPMNLKGVYPNIAEAGKAIGRHIRSLSGTDTGMANRPSPSMPVAKSDEKKNKYAERVAKIKKSIEWAKHNNLPNADDEVTKLQKDNPTQTAEDIMATQLANMMTGRNMLGMEPPKPLHGEEFIRAGEAMGLGVSQEQVAKAEQQWGGAINNWLVEASKPISARFSSPEEEQAYWDSIKVADRDDGKAGY
jgi:hypothetical protein